MGLFGSKKMIGNVRMTFSATDEVAVKDNMPDGGDVPYPLLFAFLFAGNVLSEFPGDRQEMVSASVEKLRSWVDPSDPLAANQSMLGVFSKEMPRILSEATGAQWGCEGSLLQKGDEFVVDARIASGQGDAFHRTSMDAVLETVRQRMGDKGGAVCAATLQFMEQVMAGDCKDAGANCVKAREAAAQAARWAS